MRPRILTYTFPMGWPCPEVAKHTWETPLPAFGAQVYHIVVRAVFPEDLDRCSSIFVTRHPGKGFFRHASHQVSVREQSRSIPNTTSYR